MLPDNEKGNIVLGLLVKAFRRRMVFTVGPFLSRGEDDCGTWNGIHHKTQLHDNGHGHDLGTWIGAGREEAEWGGMKTSFYLCLYIY